MRARSNCVVRRRVFGWSYDVSASVIDARPARRAGCHHTGPASRRGEVDRALEVVRMVAGSVTMTAYFVMDDDRDDVAFLVAELPGAGGRSTRP